jgi:hypothetical protein
MRMVIFEADFYPYIWSELEERLGLPISEAMIQGQHAASWDYLENNILIGWQKYALHSLPGKFVFEHIIDKMAVFGFGNIEILEYRKGRYVVVRLRHPFDVISLAWGFKGIFEFVEETNSSLAWTEEDGDYILTVSCAPGPWGNEVVDIEAARALRDAKRELSLVGRLLPAEEGKGDPCPSCGLPEALTTLEWREAEETIYLRNSGRRFIFSSGHIFMGVIRDLEERTSRDLEPMVIEITKNFHLQRLQGIPMHSRSNAYREAARYMFAGGFGNVLRISSGEGYLEMTIGNPFYIPRLVGRIAGLFEYIEDGEAEIIYNTPEPRMLELEIRTA